MSINLNEVPEALLTIKDGESVTLDGIEFFFCMSFDQSRAYLYTTPDRPGGRYVRQKQSNKALMWIRELYNTIKENQYEIDEAY